MNRSETKSLSVNNIGLVLSFNFTKNNYSEVVKKNRPIQLSHFL